MHFQFALVSACLIGMVYGHVIEKPPHAKPPKYSEHHQPRRSSNVKQHNKTCTISMKTTTTNVASITSGTFEISHTTASSAVATDSIWSTVVATTLSVIVTDTAAIVVESTSTMAPIQSDVAITDSATSIIGSADTAAASTGTTAAVTPTPTLEQNIFFTSHNDYRARHPIDAVQWSTDIAAQAAQYASQCQFQHSGTPGVGENLYAETVRSDGVDGAAQRAADAWYSEISSYDFSNGGFSSNTGHFTQLVWKSTTSIGCGAAYCVGLFGGEESGILVVCQYSPPGNVEGQFDANVLPAAV